MHVSLKKKLAFQVLKVTFFPQLGKNGQETIVTPGDCTLMITGMALWVRFLLHLCMPFSCRKIPSSQFSQCGFEGLDNMLTEDVPFILFFFLFPLIFLVVVYRPPLLTLNWQADILKVQIRSVLLQMHEEIVCWSSNTLGKEDLSSDSDSAKYFGVCPWESCSLFHILLSLSTKCRELKKPWRIAVNTID